MLKKGALASPARALAGEVLPVPGGPTSSTPRGSRALRARCRVSRFKKSTTAWSSLLASSSPATSAKMTPGCPWL